MASELPRPACPQCQSLQVIKNGSIHSGKQKYCCKTCGRQFVEQPTKKYIDDRTKEMIDNLLLERISLRGIARATGVSFKWIQRYANQKYSQTDWHAEDTEEPEAGIELVVLEADEAWSFVKYKVNQI